MKKTVVLLVAGVLAGVILAPKLHSLPLLNKLPQV